MCRSQTLTSLKDFRFECSSVESRIDDFVDKELELSEHQAVERHLGCCGNCRAKVDSLRSILDCAKELAAAPIPKDVSQRLHARIAIELSNSAQARRAKLYAIK